MNLALNQRGMNLQLQIEQMSGYLAARYTGAGLLQDLWQQFESLTERCKSTNNDKLLIDTTGFDVKVSFFDRFYLGEKGRIFARYGLKVVFACRPEQLDPDRFALRVAQNRGINVEVFTDFQAAEEWLLK